jgi:hypothetical protein
MGAMSEERDEFLKVARGLVRVPKEEADREAKKHEKAKRKPSSRLARKPSVGEPTTGDRR